MSVLGVINATEVGEALVARLTSDGRKVISGVDAAAMKRIGAEARLVLVDARRDELPKLIEALGAYLDPNHLVVHTVHGLGADSTAASLIEQHSAVRRTGVLAGPLLVPALREGRPTAAVIASRHPEVVEEAAEMLSTPKLRVYRSRDPVGVELSASLAELAVLACGMADALGLGATARGLVVVRAVRELGRLIQAIGGDPITATGLAGLGDVLVRGSDANAAAYRLGIALAKGGAPDETTVATLEQTAARLSALVRKHKVRAHVFEALASLFRDKIAPAALVEQLMTIPVLDE